MLLREGSQMSSLKPGDWIEITYTSIYHMKPFITKYISDELINSKFIKSIKLWQPKVGEWCWFWDENYTTAILAKFENISNGLFVEHHGNIFEYCEPFIGQLPTHLKDQS